MIRDIALLVLLAVFGAWGIALGGIAYALISNAQRLPVVGAVFRLMLGGPAPLIFPVKLLCWAVSASGLLIGLGIFTLIFGAPAGRVEYWIILGVSVAVILKNLERSSFFTLYQPVDIRSAARLLRLGKEHIDFFDRNRPRLALLQYIDMNVATFLSLFVAYALILHAIGPLGLLPANQPLPGIGESLWASLSLLSIVGGRPAPYSGTAWEVVNGIAAFVVWLYVILFTSFGTRILDELLDEEEEEEGRLSRVMAGIEAQVASAAGAAAAPPPPPPARPAIGRARVAKPKAKPPGQAPE